MIKFITGNKGKVAEITAILAPIKIQPVNIDLDEIQELDPYKIVKHKLQEAFKHHHQQFFIEDTATYYKAFKGQLPGTLMKWFLLVLGNPGLYKLAKKMGNTKAVMETIICYAKDKKHVYYFKGTTLGNIVSPKGVGGFGLDKIFKPLNSKKTLAQMSEEEKSRVSPRGKAALKLKKFLQDEKR